MVLSNTVHVRISLPNYIILHYIHGWVGGRRALAREEEVPLALHHQIEEVLREDRRPAPLQKLQRRLDETNIALALLYSLDETLAMRGDRGVEGSSSSGQ